MVEKKINKSLCDERTNSINGKLINLNNKFDKFLENHFQHFKEEMNRKLDKMIKKIDNLEEKVAKVEVKVWLLMGIYTLTLGTLIAIILKMIFRGVV